MTKDICILLLAALALSTSGCIIQRTTTDSAGYTTSREILITEPITETILNASD